MRALSRLANSQDQSAGEEDTACTVEDLLDNACETLDQSGIDNPRMEARLILALALGVSYSAVAAGLCRPPTSTQVHKFHDLLQLRAHHVPFAHLRGTQEFYGLPFIVTPDVLIPRPETEMLVDFALERLRHYLSKGEHPIVADVGTGSGCIAVAIGHTLPEVSILASDISDSALDVARRNVDANTCRSSVRLLRCSFLDSLGVDRFDVIVSNPPYIPLVDVPKLQPEVRDFEPRIALTPGLDALVPFRAIASGAIRALKPGGSLAAEVGIGQADEVARLFREAGLGRIEIRRDLAGIARLVCGTRPNPNSGRSIAR